MALEMWNGSVWVTVTLGMSPIRFVTGATQAATMTASRRPRTRSVRTSSPVTLLDCSPSESSSVRKSSPAPSAARARSAQ